METISLSNKKILIIDDEEDIVRLIRTVLKKEGFQNIYYATNLEDGFKEFNKTEPDIVILDIMLPDGEGYELCKTIRSKSKVPILFLSAKGEEIDKILGFAIGGDDYITKPFSTKELAYRVKAHLRRYSYVENVNEEKNILSFGPFELNISKAEFKKDGELIELKPKELALITFFAKHPNQIISKEKICDNVWGEDYYGFDNTIMVHIRRLREKIEKEPSRPEYLINVKGLGYKLVIKNEK
ncbi:response regulator transcription factor [Clostridium botulinum]|uniref:Stage 0 sporulation protein A homolog n=1 Tax=Clostridium botulinum (strain Okra / Type B1) TaxID=498213 RepID=B1IHV4_CLOBK|nr:response regulator transcription factor [Clostridium botulinum]EKX81018.1 DNA-binding response regulator [Clostridium botulinum CFSAN001628]ACA44690.1 DNA-binding response regulator [Clostridium botulinum B1 str. Okra]MBD5562516.1 response regulator transcription factor [Clostridium botulinum]MBD5565487.1 response regulator transcription factor [Clostridium botulinum]MBD5569995.1 response regulator transcription factor [Clostridium botulinum]